MLCLRVSTATGRVEEVVAEAMEWQEPRAMSTEAEQIVGITKADLLGRRFNTLKLFRLLSLTDLVIAHNAMFDRPFLEKCLPVLADMPWGCSFIDIDWKTKQGLREGSLDYLLARLGRAVSGQPDAVCRELAYLLEQPLPRSEETALKRLIEVADRVTVACSVDADSAGAVDILKSLGFKDQGDYWAISCPDAVAADQVELELVDRAVDNADFETLRLWRTDARSRFKTSAKRT
jgi:DNA polymerase-3 subunit epsilon